MTKETTCQILKALLTSIGVKSAADFTDFSLGNKDLRERNRDIVARCVFDGDTLQSAALVYGINKQTVRHTVMRSSRLLAKTRGVDVYDAYIAASNPLRTA